MTNIDKVLAFNREYVASEKYREHVTDKFPDRKLAVLSCMDTRLSVLLQEALGLKNGDAKIIKNAGALVPSKWDSAMRSIIVAVYELGVDEIMVVAHTNCGACHMGFSHFKEEMLRRGIPEENLTCSETDLEKWLEGFHDTAASVCRTVIAIKAHPLMPADIVVRGFIIDSVTGELTEIDRVMRIREMEKLYNSGTSLDVLSDYMSSGLWKEDYEADERGEIPHDIKRGVLSQDGLYNLLQEHEANQD